MSTYTVSNDKLSEQKYSYLPATTFYDMFRVSTHMILTGYKIDPECQVFLDENMDVSMEIPRIVSKVNEVVGNDINPLFEIIKDEDNLAERRLAIIFNIPNRSYDEILKLWSHVSKNVYESIDAFVGNKIAIILDGG